MEKKGKIWTGLLAAALILIGVVAFAGFHQAAKWQESVRKEIQRLNWLCLWVIMTAWADGLPSKTVSLISHTL